jgi:hypothetical protein
MTSKVLDLAEKIVKDKKSKEAFYHGYRSNSYLMLEDIGIDLSMSLPSLKYLENPKMHELIIYEYGAYCAYLDNLDPSERKSESEEIQLSRLEASFMFELSPMIAFYVR